MESGKSQSARAASIKNESGQPAYAVARERGNDQPIRAAVRGGRTLSVCLCCGQSEWQRSICPRWVQVGRKRPARLRCGQGRTETVIPSAPESRVENALLTGAARERRCDAAMNREAAACRPIRRATIAKKLPCMKPTVSGKTRQTCPCFVFSEKKAVRMSS